MKYLPLSKLFRGSITSVAEIVFFFDKCSFSARSREVVLLFHKYIEPPPRDFVRPRSRETEDKSRKSLVEVELRTHDGRLTHMSLMLLTSEDRLSYSYNKDTRHRSKATPLAPRELGLAPLSQTPPSSFRVAREKTIEQLMTPQPDCACLVF